MKVEPTNINVARVVFLPDERMRDAPIELIAGCSWADLTIEGVEALIASLQFVVAEARAEKAKR